MIEPLDKIILRHDLYAAVNRFEITNDDSEMTTLEPCQLVMYLEIVRAMPGDALWLKIQEILESRIS